MGRGAVLLLLPLVAVAFLVRIVAAALLRRRRPAAAAVERWWLWLPLAAVLVAVTVARPLIGLVVTLLTVVVLSRASSLGSPFRPR